MLDCSWPLLFFAHLHDGSRSRWIYNNKKSKWSRQYQWYRKRQKWYYQYSIEIQYHCYLFRIVICISLRGLIEKEFIGLKIKDRSLYYVLPTPLNYWHIFTNFTLFAFDKYCVTKNTFKNVFMSVMLKINLYCIARHSWIIVSFICDDWERM